MSDFVVDASVAIKWFVPEPGWESTIRLLSDEHSLASPDLLIPEVGNVLWKKVGRGEISSDEGHGILFALTQSRIEIHSSGPLVDFAFDIANETGATLYDSLYLSLATVVGPLVTADEKLVDRLRGGRFAGHVLSVEQVS